LPFLAPSLLIMPPKSGSGRSKKKGSNLLDPYKLLSNSNFLGTAPAAKDVLIPIYSEEPSPSQPPTYTLSQVPAQPRRSGQVGQGSNGRDVGLAKVAAQIEASQKRKPAEEIPEEEVDNPLAPQVVPRRTRKRTKKTDMVSFLWYSKYLIER
jgi:hypothetical protein